MSLIDEAIVSAAMYPAIGVARVGNSRDGYFISPGVTALMKHPAGFYKEATGALKRQAARFRVHGLHAAGKIVKELAADNAQLTWCVYNSWAYAESPVSAREAATPNSGLMA